MGREIPENIQYKYNFKVYWSLIRPYQRLFYGLLGIILLIESSYVVEQYLFKVVVDRLSENATGQASTIAFLSMVAAIFVSLILIRSVLKYLHLHGINRLEGRSIQDMKQHFFNHIIGLSHNFHTTHKTGSLISRLTRGARSMERMTDVLIFNTAPLLFKFTITAAALLFINPAVSYAIAVTLLSFVYFTLKIQRKQAPYTVEMNHKDDIEKAHISDFLMNIDSIKHFGKENAIKKRIRKVTEDSNKAILKHWDFYRGMDAGQSIILAMGTLAIIAISVDQYLKGQMTIGSLVFIYGSYLGLMGPLWGFIHGVREYFNAMADFEVLFQYKKITNEVRDAKHAKKHRIRTGDIEFKDVCFSYGKRKIFNKLSLKITHNHKVAFVGHSGCGKTTLMKLLYRLYDVQDGKITIDGRDIKDWEQEHLRSEMSIVPQECALFDDTIYNNVAFSKPGATRKEVMQAIRFAQLDKIIAHFPDGEATIVGERGVRLSGGEKQRVSIARAILADKKILVLDEATSALDSETEHEIQHDLAKLMEGRTSLIIAHRLSTIMHADTIIVMLRGKIVQQGSHQQLLREDGPYKKLWRLQKGGYLK